MVKVASDADRERIREIVRDVVYPGRHGVPRHAPRRVPATPAARSRASGPRPTATQLYRTAIRSWTTLDLDPEEVHQIGLDELEHDRGGAPRDRPGGRLRRRHGGLPGVARRRPGQHPEDRRTSSSSAPPRTSSARWPIAPRYFGVLPAGRLRGPRGRGVQGEGRAVRLLLPAGRRRLARRASTTPTATTCRAASTPSSPRRPTTRRRPATTSRSPSRWRTRTSTRSAGSARGWSAAPTSRAGACTASGSPTRWGCSATRPSASGCSTRRPGGRPGSSSTPGCTRCAGSASARSTSSSRPACPRPTRSSRPTATSAGRARR